MSTDAWVFSQPQQHQSTNGGGGGSIGTTGVVILVAVFAGCCILPLLLIWCWCRSDNRIITVAATLNGPPNTTPHRDPPADTGLGSTAMAALPTFPYRKTVDHSSRDEGGRGGGAQCTVCLGYIAEGEMVRLLPSCKHVYHVECIDMWLFSHSTCPYCRASANPPEISRAPMPPLPPV